MGAVEKFVWKIWGQKILKRASQVIAAGVTAWLLSPKSMETLTQMGIAVDKEAFMAFLMGATYVGAEGLRNYLKVKVGVKWL